MAQIVKVGDKEIDVGYSGLPYTDQEMEKAYNSFVAELIKKGEKESFNKEMQKTITNFFLADRLVISIAILKHMKIDINEFDKTPPKDKGLVFRIGAISYLAHKFQKNHGISEIVAWAIAVTVYVKHSEGYGHEL